MFWVFVVWFVIVDFVVVGWGGVVVFVSVGSFCFKLYSCYIFQRVATGLVRARGNF